MADPKRNLNIDYLRILAKRLQTVPVWKDLAQACNEVFGKEVDERRRKLEKIRDSVKYRRGDTLINLKYKETPNRPALFFETRENANISEDFIIKNAKVINVIKNISYYQHSDNKDYLELEFTYKDRVTRWLMPIDIPQERDALLKNAYIMGFDFFNTKLNDEDLQRLYEFVQMYWDESGSDDNFMKFIGFIKNARFDLVPLYSYEDDDAKTYDELRENPDKDVYPVLTSKPIGAQSVYKGGKWYLTSHVEIRYDISQFGDFYTLNLDDLETLFYYFAPIILVLERIVGSLEVETDVAILSVSDLTQINYDLIVNNTDSECNNYRFSAADVVQGHWDFIKNKTEHVNTKTVLNSTDITLMNKGSYEFSNNEDNAELFSLSVPVYQAFYSIQYNHTLLDYMNYGSTKTSVYDEIEIKRLLASNVVIYNYEFCNTSLTP